jgi:hypothetical protein
MAITRVQALQLLGLKVGASTQQITDAYHKQHPAAERAAAEGKPERLKRLDEAFKLLMMETDKDLKEGMTGEAAPAGGKKEVDAAQFRREQERINRAGGGGMFKWLLILVIGGGLLGAAYFKLLPIPGLK